MTKVNLGDYVYVDHYHKNGTVISDRGGHVGRWFIRFDDGSDGHVSSRDCTVIKSSTSYHSTCRLTTDEKLDLLLEHLGLRIEDSPSVVQVEGSTEINER